MNMLETSVREVALNLTAQIKECRKYIEELKEEQAKSERPNQYNKWIAEHEKEITRLLKIRSNLIEAVSNMKDL